LSDVDVAVSQDKRVKRKKVAEETVDAPAIYRQVFRRKRWCCQHSLSTEMQQILQWFSNSQQFFLSLRSHHHGS